jgi:CO/xanthine dehydrogenase FAD-binding subunit
VLERNVCEEDTKGLNWEQVKEESNRCFNCGCVAVSPSDLAPALIALEAKIETTKRTIPAEEFFRAGIMKSTVLEEDEIVKAVEIPKKNYDTKQAFLKFRIRKTIDFPIVGVAVVLSIDSGKIQNARIALSGVAPIPLRSIPAEAALIGKEINEENAEASGEAATIGTIPLSQNRYIIQIIKTMIKRAILSCR